MKLYNILHYASVPVGIAGVVCYFLGADKILYICAALSLLHSVLNIRYGGQNNLATEVITVIVAALAALIFKLPYLRTICVFLCAAELFFLLLAIVPTLALLFRPRGKK